MTHDERPRPLTPADCDLTDFKFMPLLVQRLRDSDLASEQTPEENWAAVLLWGASWHQVPAASLPDVDATIAKWAGYMMRGKIDARWKEIRTGAMRGFILCSDGRWYHPVVAELALEAWIGKLKQRLKTECSRIKKHNERHGTRIPFPDFDAWMAAGCPVGQPLPVPGDTLALSPGHAPPVTGETPSKGQGEGQRQGQGIEDSPSGLVGRTDLPPCPVEQLVQAYHDTLPELPKVRLLSDKRRKAIRHLWRFALTTPKSDGTPRATNAAEAVQWCREYFARVRENDFLMGRTPRVNGHQGWECDLDFLLSDRGMKHVIEKTREVRH